MKKAVSVLVWVGLICVLGATSGAWIGNSDEETRFCRSVCNICGCVGFSCGEECLCECRQKKVEDKYMACITDARSASEPLDKMDYDIVVQGPNGNGRISRSVVTKDVNPEQVFPSEFVFNAAQDDGEEVAVAAPTSTNVQTGWNIVKSLDIKPIAAALPAALPAPQFRALDHEALRLRFAELQTKLGERLPAPAVPEVQPLPKVSLPALPVHNHHITLPVAAAPVPAAPVPAPVVIPTGEHFKNFREFMARPLQVRENISITH